ncbi:MAG: CxxC-x17-CxxC domain-containing protein [Patescibacteria group bacterium]
MNNFRKGGFGQGRRSSSAGAGARPRFGDKKSFGSKFSGGRDRGGRPEGRMELFPAVCFECKRNCEVPFRPTGDKPVYCLDCFNKQPHVPGRNSAPIERPRGDFRSDFRPPQREYQPQPEPVRIQNDGSMDLIKRQLGALEIKVNRILELMSQKTESSASKVPVVEKAVKIEKLAKAKTPTKKVGVKGKK